VWAAMATDKFLYQELTEFYHQSDREIDTEDLSWLIRGIVLGKLGRYEEAIGSYDRALATEPMNPDILYNRGLAFVALGQREEAIAVFKQAVKIEPDYYRAWRDLAFLFFALDRLEQAVAAWNKALALEPDDPRSWYDRGLALSRLNRLDDAINSYTKALEIKPDYQQARSRLARLLAELDRFNKSRRIKILEYKFNLHSENRSTLQAIDLEREDILKSINVRAEDPKKWFNWGVELCDLESYEDALKFLSIALKIKDDYSEAWYYQGLALCKLNHYQEAISSCDRALSINPDYQEAWDRRGISLMRLGDFEDAIASFKKAISFNPDLPEVLNDIGACLNGLRQYEEAITSWDRALEIQPNFFDAMNNRGIALSSLGRHEEAIASFSKALVINPASFQSWENLGLIQHYYLVQYQDALFSYNSALKFFRSAEILFHKGILLAELGDEREALNSYKESVFIDPNFDMVWIKMGRSQQKLGEYEESIVSCNNALAINPNSYEGWTQKGWSLINLTNYEDAIESFQEAIKLKPDSDFVLNYLGLAFSKCGRYREAIASYDRSLEINPNSSQIWNDRGVAAYNLGLYQEAVDSYRQALSIEPNNEKIRENLDFSLQLLNEINFDIDGKHKNQKNHLNDDDFPWTVSAIKDVLLEQDRKRNMSIKHQKRSKLFRQVIYLLIFLLLLTLIIFLFLNVGKQLLALIGIGLLYLAVQTFLSQGVVLHSQGKYAAALAFYDWILKFLPRSSSYWFERGRSLVSLAQEKAFDRHDLFEEALNSYDRAIRLRPKNHLVWNSRGLLLHKMGRDEEAIDSYDRALNIQPDSVALSNRAGSLLRLKRFDEAIVSLDQSIRIHPNNISTWRDRGIALLAQEKYEEAIDSFNQALAVYPSFTSIEELEKYIFDNPPVELAAIPEDKRAEVQVARFQNARYLKEFALAKLADRDGDINSAISHYYQSISLAELSFIMEPRQSRNDEVIQGSIRTSFFSLINALVKADRLEEAIEIVEKTKGRTLKEQYQDFTNKPFRYSAPKVTEGRDRTLDGLNRVQEALGDLLNNQYQMAYENDPTIQTSISSSEIRNLLPSSKTVLIEWFISGEAIHAFVITKTTNRGRFIKVFSIGIDKSEPTSNDPIKSNNLLDWFNSYEQNYAKLREDIIEKRELNLQKQRWDKDLSLRLQELSQLLKINDIIDYIDRVAPNSDGLIIVPHLFLHLLPLHALPYGSKGNILLDRFPNGIRYLPSCSLLKLMQVRSERWDMWNNFGGYNRADEKKMQTLFAFQNPTTNLHQFPPLKYSNIEVETISKFFANPVVFKEDKANKENFLLPRPSKNCIHFSGHGFFSYVNPLESALMLADRQEINLADITRDSLQKCYLVTLPACESGITDFSKMTDEFLGLPSSFLIAGARTVVSSLWLVDDLPTALLMIKFYEHLTREESISSEIVSIALNQAQQWLRRATIEELETWIEQLPLEDRVKFYLTDEELPKRGSPDSVPFANPYYWAAFCTIG
jgi:tetratricopeptide (TPR) repeat protein/CHAT domain-containing protein